MQNKSIVLSLSFMMLVSFCSSAEVTEETPISTLTEETPTTMQDTTSTTSTTSTTMPMKNISKSDTLTNTDSFSVRIKEIMYIVLLVKPQ